MLHENIIYSIIGSKEAFKNMAERKVFKRDMRVECPIFCVAESVLENVEERERKELYDEMVDYMYGFTENIQLEIANDLLDAVCYAWEHYIGIRHIDQKLKNFYQLIDKEMSGQYLEDSTDSLLKDLKEVLKIK